MYWVEIIHSSGVREALFVKSAVFQTKSYKTALTVSNLASKQPGTLTQVIAVS